MRRLEAGVKEAERTAETTLENVAALAITALTRFCGNSSTLIESGVFSNLRSLWGTPKTGQ
jgi:hypothetical protein